MVIPRVKNHNFMVQYVHIELGWLENKIQYIYAQKSVRKGAAYGSEKTNYNSERAD